MFIYSLKNTDLLPAAAKLLQLCWNLYNSMDCSLPGSSVRGILQARILEWVAMPSSRGSSRPRDPTHIFYGSCIAGVFFTTEPPGSPVYFLTALNSLYFLLVFQLVLVFFWIYLQVCIYICSCGTIRISDRHLPNFISFISKIISILQTKTLKLREVIDLDRITLLIEPGFESQPILY